MIKHDSERSNIDCNGDSFYAHFVRVVTIVPVLRTSRLRLCPYYALFYLSVLLQDISEKRGSLLIRCPDLFRTMYCVSLVGMSETCPVPVMYLAHYCGHNGL